MRGGQWYCARTMQARVPMTVNEIKDAGETNPFSPAFFFWRITGFWKIHAIAE